MSILPMITFKAGICEIDQSTNPPKVTPVKTPGYIYLYSEDDLLHFCWRPRSANMDEAELDLVMIPADAQFKPYDLRQRSASFSEKPATNGRIVILKFMGSSERKLFWLQSKSQSSSGDLSWFSARDLKLVNLVDNLLQGEEIDMPEALDEVRNANEDQDDDETMEDVEGGGDVNEHHQGGSGGAGPGATGGDIREEGEGPREGGADGGRAASANTTDASAIVQNFLQSLQGQQSLGQGQNQTEKPFTTLPDLLPSSTTIPVVEAASVEYIDNLLSNLPPSLLLLAEGTSTSSTEPNPAAAQAALQTLSLDQKKNILQRVLRSPQFHQSLGSLTVALRDGGLPSISDALRINVERGGFMRHGGMPIGGSDAVRAFLEGIKATVKEEISKNGSKEGKDRMDSS